MTRITQTDGSPAAGYAITDKRVDLAYNAVGQFTTIARYEDLAATDLVATTTHGYDGAGRLTSLDHVKAAVTFAAYDWTFDNVGRITSVTSPDGTSTFTYDTTDQLTLADHSYQNDETLAWDANGNPTGTGCTIGAHNLLVSDATYDYQYDAEGNRTRRTEKATGNYLDYDWDHRNRLVAVEHRTSSGSLTKRVELTYDAFDRWIGKRVDDDGDGTFDRAESYVYDGADLMLVFDGTGSLTNRLLHGPATDQVFADEDALGEILWNLSDNQQTVRDVVDYDAATDTTSVVNHLTYNAFGQIASQSDAAYEPIHTYTGQVWDVDAFHYNARWYDAGARRFLSHDPSGLGPDTNRYRYVGNSPTNFTDPAGLQQQSIETAIDLSADVNVHIDVAELFEGQQPDVNQSFAFPLHDEDLPNAQAEAAGTGSPIEATVDVYQVVYAATVSLTIIPQAEISARTNPRSCDCVKATVRATVTIKSEFWFNGKWRDLMDVKKHKITIKVDGCSGYRDLQPRGRTTRGDVTVSDKEVYQRDGKMTYGKQNWPATPRDGDSRTVVTVEDVSVDIHTFDGTPAPTTTTRSPTAGNAPGQARSQTISGTTVFGPIGTRPVHYGDLNRPQR